MGDFKVFLTVILLTIFVVDFCNGEEIFAGKIENFGDEAVEEEVVKKADGTKIKIPESHKWNDDFKRRFESHEEKENLKMASLLSDFLRNNHVIDTGAHVGDTGLYLALKAREIGRDDIKIIMIEPDKSKVEYINLLADINGLTNVVTMNYGLGMIQSRGSLDRSDNNEGGWKVITDSNKDEFIIERLDALITRRYHQIGLMHIDVEGMEHQVLLGADRLLNTTRYIMIELNHLTDRSKERDLLGDHLFKKIESSGYANGNELYRRI